MKSFFARFQSSRFVRHGTWLLVSLITLYAVICAVVNWTGSRRWAETRALLAREGETLDFNKLLPAPIGDSHNFCAIEPLRDIALPGDGKSMPGIRRAALESTAWQSAFRVVNPGQVPRRKVEPSPPLMEGPEQGRPMDLQAWAAYARTSGYASLPADSGDAARDLLTGIDASLPLLKQLAEAAMIRTDATFVPTMQASRPLYAMAIPHMGPLQKVSVALTLRAVAASQAGDSAAACASALAVLRFTEALARDPLLIGTLVAFSTHDAAEEAVWSITARKQATAPELETLQAGLAKLDFYNSMLMAMRGELASAIETLEYFQNDPRRSPELLSIVSSLEAPAPPAVAAVVLWRLLPTGLFDHNKAVMATLELEHCIRPLRHVNPQDLMRQRTHFEALIKGKRSVFHLDHFFASLAIPAIIPLVDRAISVEALRRQGLAACALERYFIEHQAYPASLADLVPAFLGAVPADPVDEKPMRYRQTADGRYRLWSISVDQKDDGGTVGVDPVTGKTNGRSRKPGYQGDWTWQYQPVK